MTACNELTKEKENEIAREIKNALLKESDKRKKIQILTTVPAEWSSREMQKYLGVSRRLASNAKKLRDSEGYNSLPGKRIGRRLPEIVIQQIKNFYVSDKWSRLMPGKKDYISVVKYGKRQQLQKRLLLADLKELYHECKSQFPDMKISLSKFSKLRPPECITVGTSGTHNVCVCKIHQNLHLKFVGINFAFEEMGAALKYSVQNVRDGMMCSNRTSSCYLLNCKKCPGPQTSCDELRELFTQNNVKEINYSQWTNTDR